MWSGMVVALAVILSTFPLLSHFTEPARARVE
jgi:hypothetical protein